MREGLGNYFLLTQELQQLSLTMLPSLSRTPLSSLPHFLICTLLTHALELEEGGKPDWLIDLFPPPFSDSAVIQILINMWWGVRGAACRIYPIAGTRIRPERSGCPECIMNPS